MPFCPNCGTQIPDLARFCTNCGKELVSTSTEAKPPQLATAVPPGSRVSFVAGDGKPYTGTIIEARDGQYRVKYDSMNFEAWLGQGQFALIQNSSTPPINTAGVSSNSNLFTHQAGTATQGSTLLHPGFWGSLLVIIGFFLPWLRLDFDLETISGFDIVRSAQGIIRNPGSDSFGIVFLGSASVIIVGALVSLLYLVGIAIGRGVFSIVKWLPLLAAAGLIGYIAVQSKGGGDAVPPGEIWTVLGLGAYFTVGGALLLAISRSRR
jgi:hypothetical protein